MTQVGEGVAVTIVKEEASEDLHYAAIEVCYPNGQPYQDYVSITPTIDGDERSGSLNFDGVYWDTMLEPGTAVSYQVGENVDDELDEARAEIKTVLDAIIQLERDQQLRDDALLADENVVMQGLILTGAFMTGVGEGAVGLFDFAVDTVELGGKALWMNVQAQANVLEAAWEKYAEGDEQGYFDSLNEKNVEDFAKIFGITPKEIAIKMSEAYEILAFIMDDSETRGMLLQFAEDYVLAQSKVEVANIVGSAAFDIILAALLAATTGGAGNVAQVLSKVRHAGRFSTLAIRMKKFVKLGKRKKLHTNVSGQLDGKVKVEIEAPAAIKVETNRVKDKDLDANSHKDKNSETDASSDSDSASDGSTNASADAEASKTSASDTATDQSGTNKANKVCSKDDKTCTGGEPISLVTGEEILPLVDFRMEGPLPLIWERKYKSSNPDNIGLGHGWTHSFADYLVVNESSLELHDAEARIIPFAIPAVGRSTHNLSEKLSLKRLSQAGYVLSDSSSNIEKFFDTASSTDKLNITQIRDKVGNRYYLYYANNSLDRIQASHGDVWDFSYQGSNISSVEWCPVSGSKKTLVRYQYDDSHDLLGAVDAVGHGESYQYRNHLLAKRTLKTGYSFYFEWDADTPNARCIHNWGDPINHKATYDYTFKWDDQNNGVAVTDTRGGITVHHFNDRGLPVYIKDPEGGETFYHYDALGNVTREVDAQGSTQHYVYNRQQQLTAFTNKQGYKRQFVWDKNGNQIQHQDPLGQRWTSEFNTLNQLVRRTNPLGESYHYQYNELGLTNRVIDPDGNDWSYLWDNQAHLTAIRNPLGQNTRYSYDSEGQLNKITWPDGQFSHYRYDANGNCIAIKSPDGKVQNYQYNALGLLSLHKDDSGRQTRYEYNGLSQVVRRIDPTGQRLDYHYDGERNLIGLSNEKNEHYHLKYDLNERLVQEVGFDGRVQRYSYNSMGHLLSSEDYSPDGKKLLNQVTYHRDIEGRLLRQNDGKTGKRLNEFSYDPLGRLQDARNGHSHLHWQYDAAGRVLEDHQGEQVLKHTYSHTGQRVGSLLPNGDKLDYRFDPTGAFVGMSYNGESVADISRDQMGREIQRQLSNNLVTEQNFDPQGRLLRQITFRQQRDSSVQAPSLTERNYHYNSVGQLSQIDDKQRGTTRYQYDSLDRLTQVQGPVPESFVHDPAGNLLSVSDDNETQIKPASGRPQVKGNRLAFQGDKHYKYDALGNRIVEESGKNQSIRSHYRYNTLNQLRDIKNDNIHTQYAYDPLGRRIIKADREKRTGFVWLDDVLLSEVTILRSANVSKDSDTKRKDEKLYLFEPYSFKPIGMVQNQQLYHYHLDHLGTPQEITDADGKVVWAVSYKAYGNLAVAHENEIENNLRFQGQYFDEESGLHYNRFRYYDPSVGRFINQDPIGLLGGMNSYQYAPNPIGWVDPFGLTCKENTWNEFQKANKGNYANSTDTSKAYKALVQNESPWPDGFDPPEATLVPGTKVNMAMSPTQVSTRPGGFGTFDNIPNVDYVRKDLAVKQDWKPEVDRVVTYEVIKPLPVRAGPVGPQIDKGAGKYLSGGGSQVEMTVPPKDRMSYLKIVSETPIK